MNRPGFVDVHDQETKQPSVHTTNLGLLLKRGIFLKNSLETVLKENLREEDLVQGLSLVRTDILSQIIMLLSGQQILK